MRVFASAALTLCVACEAGLPPPPEALSTGGEAADPDATEAGSTTGVEPTTGSATGGETTGVPATAGPSGTTASTTTTGSATTGSASTGDVTAGVGDTGTSTGEPPPPPFDPPAPFGDDQVELDLVGTWGLPTFGDPGTRELQLSIFPDGSFSWTEFDVGCEPLAERSGSMWIESTQLVLHVTEDVGPPIWDTAQVIGRDVEAPYRMRLGYAAMGQFLGLAGPGGLTVASPWVGRSYDRLQAGSGPQGSWAAEAELIAAFAGEPSPVVVVRDRFEAALDPGGDGLLTQRRTYWWPTIVAMPPVYADGTWVDGTPGLVAGAATIGDVPHAYDPLHLITFAPWQAFKRDAPIHCQ